MKKIKSVFLYFLVGMMVLGMAGCGASESPQRAVENMLNAVKAADVQTASRYIDYDDLVDDEDGLNSMDRAESEEFVRMIFQNLSYKIVSTDESGDKATVTVEITNIDMASVMQELLSQSISLAFSGADEDQLDEKMMGILKDLLNKADAKTVTNTVNIKLDKDDGQWEIDMSDKLENALLGGMLTIADSLGDSMGASPKLHENRLDEIEDWVTDDIWNRGFCDIGWYAYQGTGSTGHTLDISFTLQQLDQAMQKKAGYDQYISSLSGPQYDQVKMVWGTLSAEIDTLYSQVKANPPVAKDSSTDIDTGKFQQYEDAFSDAVDALD